MTITSNLADAAPPAPMQENIGVESVMIMPTHLEHMRLAAGQGTIAGR